MFSDNPARLYFQIIDYLGKAYREHKAEQQMIDEQPYTDDEIIKFLNDGQQKVADRRIKELNDDAQPITQEGERIIESE